MVGREALELFHPSNVLDMSLPPAASALSAPFSHVPEITDPTELPSGIFSPGPKKAFR